MHDLTGRRFGRLTVLYVSGRKHNRLLWHCECDCGNEIDLTSNRLLHVKGTKSCGCLRKEVSAKRATKHGLSNTRIYKIWSGIKDRCLNLNDTAYKHYGGRGIKICNRWLDFQNFYDDMIETYSDDLTIDRIDFNGDYEPSNCRWATQGEQVNNTRRCKFITYKGETDTVKRICEKYNVKYDRVVRKIKSGQDPTELIKKYKIK
jgi:hypothetical protein